MTVLDPTDQIPYSTYLGGTGDNAAQAIALDADVRVHVGGGTESADFPFVEGNQTEYGGQRDGFVAVLNQSVGELHFATFLGGSGPAAALCLSTSTQVCAVRVHPAIMPEAMETEYTADSLLKELTAASR